MNIGELIELLSDLPPDTPVHTCSVLFQQTPNMWTVNAIGTEEHFAATHMPSLLARPNRAKQ